MVRTTVSIALVVIVAFSVATYLNNKRNEPLPAVQGGNAVAYKDISPADLQEWIQSSKPPVIVDVREPYETAQGYIKGAKLIPLGDLGSRFKELDPNQEIVMVCRSGNRSAQAARALVAQGYTKVYNMTGGMMAWKYDTIK